jgi:hypothetical protein
MSSSQREVPIVQTPGSPKEAPEDKDPSAIIEIGAGTNWNVSGGASTFAPNFTVETPFRELAAVKGIVQKGERLLPRGRRAEAGQKAG